MGGFWSFWWFVFTNSNYCEILLNLFTLLLKLWWSFVDCWSFDYLYEDIGLLYITIESLCDWLSNISSTTVSKSNHRIAKLSSFSLFRHTHTLFRLQRVTRIFFSQYQYHACDKYGWYSNKIIFVCWFFSVMLSS